MSVGQATNMALEGECDTCAASDLMPTDQHAPQMKGRDGSFTRHSGTVKSLSPSDPSGSRLT